MSAYTNTDRTNRLSWQEVFHKYFVPLVPVEGLEALLEALCTNDAALTQCVTVVASEKYDDKEDMTSEPAGACLIGYAAWKGYHLTTSADVENKFGEIFGTIDKYADNSYASDAIVSFWDNTDRTEAIALLIPEVELALEKCLERDGVLCS